MKNALHKGLVAIARKILEADQDASLGQLKELSRTLYEQLVVAAHQEEFALDEPPLLPRMELSTEQIKDIVAQMPAESQQVDKLLEALADLDPAAASASDPMEHYRQTVVFEPKETESLLDKTPFKIEASGAEESVVDVGGEASSVHLQHRNKQPKNRNSQHGRLMIGLNDRLVFVKQLFSEDLEGYNRVVSQITTFSSFEEATEFLHQQVKPEYGYWEGKEAVVERFLTLVAQRFNA